MNNDIITIDNAQIERINTVSEAAQVKKMADAAAVFYKAQDDLFTAQQAKVISLRSARQAGYLLLPENTPRVPAGRPKNNSSHVGRITPYQEALDGAGISTHIANVWQILAKIPDALFEEYITDPRKEQTEYSIKGLIDFARPYFQEQKRKQQEAGASVYQVEMYGEFKVDDVYLGDIETLDLPESCADMIFTDPPYHDDMQYLYSELSRFSERVLRPGGYLMVYSGKMFLPQIMNMLGNNLEYVWTYGVFQPDNNQKINKHHLFETWRPILCYKKEGKTPIRNWQPDMIKGTRDKTYHEWQQQIEPAMKWIEAYTAKGNLVVDPFVGGGTTVQACKDLERHFLGFDKDINALKLTKMRLDE